jgi:hypothetical protein
MLGNLAKGRYLGMKFPRTAGFTVCGRLISPYWSILCNCAIQHDPEVNRNASQLYRVALPQAGSVLGLVDVIQLPISGQGFAWDHSVWDDSHAPVMSQTIYGINRQQRQIIKVDLARTGEQPCNARR